MFDVFAQLFSRARRISLLHDAAGVWVAVVLLCLGMVCPSRATASVFWIFDFPLVQSNSEQFSIGVYSDRSNPITPASLIQGRLPTPGQVGEVAVATAVLHPGDSVPLPVYADGTTAQEGEIFWTAQLWQAMFDGYQFATTYRYGDNCSGGFDGRVFTWGSAVLTIASPGYRPGASTSNVAVVVTVVAVRGATPTPTRTPSFGALKAKYR